MPQLLRFEGSTPEEARSNARRAVGADATIVRAGRQRSGGVLGFFEHEVYVLEVEAGDPLDRLADSVVDAFELSGLGAGTARTDSRVAFSQLLEEAEATVAAAALAAGPQPHAPAEQRPPRPARPWRPGGRRVARDDAASPDTPQIAHATAPVTGAPAGAGAGTPAAPRASTALSPAGAGRTRPTSVAPDDDHGSSVLGLALSALGLPSSLLPDPTKPVDLGLLERLRYLPPPPDVPAAADAVVLVAGPPQHLGPLALDLAGRLGVGPEAIIAVLSRPRGVPASAIAVSSARDAAAEVAERRIARRPSVVAVECRPVGPLPRLLEHVAIAVRADTAWAVLPARCEPDQLSSLATAMRGLDALCLVELDRAERPAAVLAGGPPVATLDGRTATPILWAALLLDRCADGWRQR